MEASAKKRLVVFDVDGTLTLTMALDTELYVETVRQVLGLDEISADWSTYRNVTDTGITAELIERHRGRPAKPAEIHSVRDRFVSLLRARLAACPHRCRPTPGAARMLSALRGDSRFECAVATGAWRESALLKIGCAGLVVQDLPLATCEDSAGREGILRAAVRQASGRYGLSEDAGVVFVGDGVWDVTAARHTGLDFVGVGTGPDAQRLRDAGAERVIEDFTDLDRFLELLAREHPAEARRRAPTRSHRDRAGPPRPDDAAC